MTLPPFPVEDLLIHHPPAFEEEWRELIRKLMFTVVFFVLIAPNFIKAHYAKKTPPKRRDESSKDSFESLSTGNGKVITRTIINGKEQKVVAKQRKTKKNTAAKEKDSEEEDDKKVVEVPGFVFILLNIAFIFTIVTLILKSPNNIDTARRVYVAPLLRPEETASIIQMGHEAAARRADRAKKELALLKLENDDDKNGAAIYDLEKILEWPEGYKKDRHEAYPTTDLNVVVDFSQEDKKFLKKILDARLSPILERVYGVTRDSIRANDIFLVRYDGKGQNKLTVHQDSSHISFNVLLNDEFEGGGTRFHNRYDKTHMDAKPKVGQVLINNAVVHHEGLPTTKGTRYILVGFMNVDVKDPWTRERSDVSVFSTVLSIPWLCVGLKQALMFSRISSNRAGNTNQVFSKNFYVNSMLSQSVIRFAEIGDASAPHGIVNLVDEKDTEKFLNTLEEYHQSHPMKGARWYSGQGIYTNLDGSFKSYWKERKQNPDKFREDL